MGYGLTTTYSRDLVLVEGPAAAVLSLEDAKAQLEVTDGDWDSLIEGYIAAATELLDGPSGLLGRALLEQQWTVHFDDCFPGWRIPIPLCPLISVDTIAYVDAQGVTQIVAPSDYVVLDGPAAAVQPAYGKAWPAPRPQPRSVSITFTAGYEAVPKPIVVAIQMLVAHYFRNREATVGIDQRGTPQPTPLGVLDLIAPYRARSAA